MIQFTLTAPGLDDVIIGDCGTFGLAAHDLGSPLPREVNEDAPDTNGTIDTTSLEAGRFVTLSVVMPPTFDWHAAQRLRVFSHPRLRPTVIIEETGAPTRQFTGRLTPFADTADTTDQLAQVRRFTMQWFVPSGILESAELFTATAAASGDPAELGFTFDLTFDLTFPAMDPQGSVQVVNAGDRDAYPLLRLYGPWSDEVSISNDTTGQALVFDGLSVTAGNFLEIDTRTKTIRLNGDPTQTRNQYLLFPDSEWWALQPGEQRIRFEAETFAFPAQAQVVWRNAYS